MFVLISASHGMLDSATEVATYPTLKVAQAAMRKEVEEVAADANAPFGDYVDHVDETSARIDNVCAWQIREVGGHDEVAGENEAETGDMTDHMTVWDEEDCFRDHVCPVCKGDDTTQTETETEDDDGLVIRRFECNTCGSAFSHSYWISRTVVLRDGRHGKREQGD